MTKVENIYETDLTENEKFILRKADKILYRIQLELGNDKSTQSFENGDLVDGSEIGRARGILSHYSDSDFFIIYDKK